LKIELPGSKAGQMNTHYVINKWLYNAICSKTYVSPAWHAQQGIVAASFPN